MAWRDTAVAIAIELRQAGHEAFLAGGCVRDEEMGLEPKDWDVATSATPEQVNSIFKNTRSVGEAFGVVLVHRNGFITEIATFRTDGDYTDHRRPENVAFTNAAYDAQRRDFTVNGLFRDPQSNEIIDYVHGLADLEAGVIRAIGTPADRFDDDHLRMLRAVRLAAAMNFRLDDATADAIRLHAGSLSGVSRERVGEEMRRMLLHSNAVRAMDLLAEVQLEETVFGVVHRGGMAHLTAAVTAGMALVPRLAALAMDRGVDTETVEEEWTTRLMLSNASRNGIAAVLTVLKRLREWGTLSVAQQRRLAGQKAFEAAVFLLRVEAVNASDAIEADVAPWAAQAGGVLPPRLLDGGALLAAGVAAGPSFGVLLESIYDAQLENRVTSVEEASGLLQALRQA